MRMRFFGPTIAPQLAANRALDSWTHHQAKILINMARLKDRQTSPAVYEQLWAFESGFDQVRRALQRLGQLGTFQRWEVDRFLALLEEGRAATASYLAEAIGEAETREAGRLFRLRKTREAQED